ncbi:unnamed protein product, partial [Staurois parvus]
VSCDWSKLVTWYKAFVNSPVPCDLCDHSQISHIVSNDVRSDILLTTLHVITDSPIRFLKYQLPGCPMDQSNEPF